MRKRSRALQVLLLMSVYSAGVLAQSDDGVITLPPLNITAPSNGYSSSLSKKPKAKKINFYIKPIQRSTTDSYKISKYGVKLFAGPMQKSPLDVVNMLPSVNFESQDMLIGRATQEATFRIRGISPMQRPGSPIDIDGMPTPGGPKFSGDIVDMGNVNSVKLYEGAIPANEALGVADFPGIIDMQIEKPMNTSNVKLSQTFGSHDLNRSFLRVDSGNMNGWKLFISSSYAYSNKWKGSGNEMNKNMMFGITKNFSHILDIQLYGGYNQDKYNEYCPLTYAQALSLDYDYDCNTNPNNFNYYGYNQQDRIYNYLLSKITITPSDQTKFVFKPYYWHITGYEMEAGLMVPSTNVGKWIINNDNYGAISEYHQKFLKNYEFILGYFYHKEGRPGPPNYVENYAIKNGQLAYQGTALWSNNNHNTIYYPYMTFKGHLDRFSFNIGARYLKYEVGDTIGYNPKTGAINPATSASAINFYKFLPYVGLNYDINKSLYIFANYGRTYNLNVNLFPAFYNMYNNALSNDKTLPYTLQGLENQYLKLETADNFDLGAKYNSGKWFINPTLFYSYIKHKQAILPLPNMPSPFYADIADARSYGAELMGGYSFSDRLVAFGSYSYNRFYYTNNISALGQTYNISGNQIIDAPKNMIRGGITYKTPIGVFISPNAIYMGKRYGDMEHQQEIPSYVIFNLNIAYQKEHFWVFKDIKLGLDFMNLFNKHYISVIDTNESAAITSSNHFNPDAPNTAYYYAGMPFTVATSISADF